MKAIKLEDLQIGHVSKKELYNSLHAYLRGMGE